MHLPQNGTIGFDPQPYVGLLRLLLEGGYYKQDRLKRCTAQLPALEPNEPSSEEPALQWEPRKNPSPGCNALHDPPGLFIHVDVFIKPWLSFVGFPQFPSAKPHHTHTLAFSILGVGAFLLSGRLTCPCARGAAPFGPAPSRGW